MSRERKAQSEFARLLGIESGYWDVLGKWNELSEESEAAIMTALGFDVSSEESTLKELQQFSKKQTEEFLPPVLVRFQEELPLVVEVSLVACPNARTDQAMLRWEFFEENGAAHSGERNLSDLAVEAGKHLLPLPIMPGIGYHYLRVSLGSVAAGCRVIICPNRCYLPPELQGNESKSPERFWGLGLQLPALKSERNWGIGDFADLRSLGQLAASQGAKFIGINPLHVLPPGGASPYSPSSRLEIQPLFLALDEVVEFSAKKVQTFLKTKKTQAELSRLRSAVTVDYLGVWKLKSVCMRLMFEEFEKTCLSDPDSKRAEEFFAFLKRRGEGLRLFALHSALAAHFSEDMAKPEKWAWIFWPKEFRNPHSAAVKKFAAKAEQEILFYQYQAFLAETQLGKLQAEFVHLGLSLRTYGDVALGVDAAGAEAWIHQDIFVPELSLGAPPDALGPLGQVWGLPAVSPFKLRDEAYAPFIDLLRRQTEYCGALRLDHVMSLFRLFVIPRNMSAAQGGYLRYPLHDLAGIVALESVRNKTVIIGEDLGTVPEEVTRCMKDRRMLSYKVFFFMREGEGFLAARNYEQSALVVTSTHDLPTLEGYLSKADIQLRAALGQIPESQAAQEMENREHEIKQLSRLQTQDGSGLSDATPLGALIHGYLAEAPSLLQLVQLDDILARKEQWNVPGTVNEYPNWSQRYVQDLSEVLARLQDSAVVQAVAAKRG